MSNMSPISRLPTEVWDGIFNLVSEPSPLMPFLYMKKTHDSAQAHIWMHIKPRNIPTAFEFATKDINPYYEEVEKLQELLDNKRHLAKNTRQATLAIPTGDGWEEGKNWGRDPEWKDEWIAKILATMPNLRHLHLNYVARNGFTDETFLRRTERRITIPASVKTLSIDVGSEPPIAYFYKAWTEANRDPIKESFSIFALFQGYQNVASLTIRERFHPERYGKGLVAVLPQFCSLTEFRLECQSSCPPSSIPHSNPKYTEWVALLAQLNTLAKLRTFTYVPGSFTPGALIYGAGMIFPRDWRRHLKNISTFRVPFLLLPEVLPQISNLDDRLTIELFDHPLELKEEQPRYDTIFAPMYAKQISAIQDYTNHNHKDGLSISLIDKPEDVPIRIYSDSEYNSVAGRFAELSLRIMQALAAFTEHNCPGVAIVEHHEDLQVWMEWWNKEKWVPAYRALADWSTSEGSNLEDLTLEESLERIDRTLAMGRGVMERLDALEREVPIHHCN